MVVVVIKSLHIRSLDTLCASRQLLRRCLLSFCRFYCWLTGPLGGEGTNLTGYHDANMEFINPIKYGAELTGAPEAALALIFALTSALPLSLMYVISLGPNFLAHLDGFVVHCVRVGDRTDALAVSLRIILSVPCLND